MKILHLSGENEDVGGVLSVIRNLQSASKPWGWRHTVCVDQRYVERRQPALTYWRSRHVRSDLPNHAALLLQAIRTCFELKRFLAREAFDILHAHSRGTFLVGVAAALWLKRTVLFTNHGYSQRVRMYRWGARVRRFHTAVLTPNMARHYGLREAPPKINIISECCSDQFFREPLVARRDAANANAPVRLVGVGNIMRWKNWHLLAEALLKLGPKERQRLTFSLWGPNPCDAGSQSYAAELRELVHRSGLEEVFLFRGETLSVTDCLQEADWFVLPSTNEPCSVALIEALALGLPALVSRSGGNVDIVTSGETGLFFEPGNSSDLAAKLQTAAQGNAAVLPPDRIRNSVRSRSASVVAAHYKSVYERLLAS
ncbi:MAG: glycosyltransferase family 4 protein [Verrucomicrobia bacterium]|nr:glycosyltransferase family 4 protein [Verrucomicrobiota bacterium]